MTKVFCGNRECFHYGTAGCVAEEIWHTSESFCTAYRRKGEDRHAELMRESEPKGRRKNGKWVGN